MFSHRLTILRLFGFDIKVDFSWVFLLLLISWSLATGLFPSYYPGQSQTIYWAMGIGGAFALFTSIILHELGHSIVARRYGIEITDITLFIFGGLAHMESEPKSAKAEFRMAAAGPITSVVLAAGLYALYGLLDPPGQYYPWLEVMKHVAFLNAILAGFNLVPAFPLDGGRMLRAMLWQWKDNYAWATRVAAGIGGMFGFMLIAFGFITLIRNNFISGLWFLMIGLFIRTASKASLTQVMLKRVFEEETVRRFMKPDPVTAPPELTLRQLVEDYIYHHHYKLYPVTQEGRVLGCVTTRDVKKVPREQWDARTVGEILTACNDHNTIGPDRAAFEALEVMNRTGNSRLMVVDDGTLLGIIALKDLLEYVTLKFDLEGPNLPEG